MKSALLSGTRAMASSAVLSATLALVVAMGHAQSNGPATPAPARSHHHYQLIDLGTFGGPTSFFPGFTVPVNLGGVVVGCADSAVLDPNVPTQNPYFGGDPYIQIAYTWSGGIRTRLRTLPGGTNACTQWINDYGAVAPSMVAQIFPRRC